MYRPVFDYSSSAVERFEHCFKGLATAVAPHFHHFGWNTGKCQQSEQILPTLNRLFSLHGTINTGGGSVRIPYRHCTLRLKGLPFVGGSHSAAAPLKKFLNHSERRFVFEKRYTSGISNRLSGQIVGSGTESAGRNNEIDSIHGNLENTDHFWEIIDYGGVIEYRNADPFQFTAQPLRVGVEDFSIGDFVADCNNFCVHFGGH
jgi:hypothetical protein